MKCKIIKLVHVQWKPTCEITLLVTKFGATYVFSLGYKNAQPVYFGYTFNV